MDLSPHALQTNVKLFSNFGIIFRINYIFLSTELHKLPDIVSFSIASFFNGNTQIKKILLPMYGLPAEWNHFWVYLYICSSAAWNGSIF